ncbi:MAG: HAD hydrolase family protein [Gammaproteobacteria bacterium]|nr:HAD hydrolase family protein [Gammaproteobacteria bacterium]
MSVPSEARLAAIRLLALDVDGVLTDGRLWYFQNGEESKAFHVQDGHGLKRLMRAGIEVALITARRSPVAALRARELGIERYHENVADKGERLRAIADDLGIPLAACAYMGDDEPDLAALEVAGLAIAPANAVAAVRVKADWCCQARGGEGAVREVCEMLLTARAAA